MLNIGIDARINQTGVGRYTKNLFDNIRKLDKINHYSLLKPAIPWHSVMEQIYFPIWLAGKKFDLVHFTYFSFPLLCPKKFVLTIHDLIPWHFATGKASTLPSFLYYVKQFFYKIILWFGVRRASKIIAVSQSTKNDLVKTLHINPEKIEVIYEGVDKNLGMPSKTETLHDYILYVGNAYPHKNLDRLIGAYEQVRKEKKNFPQLVLVGPDDYFYKKLKIKIRQLGLEDSVVFSGSADDSKLSYLYKNARFFVTPSLAEGFGLPGVEAMSCSCPVVCSDIAVFREIYREAALYFNPYSIDDLKKTLIQVIDLPDIKRNQLIMKGKSQSKFFSWKECARKTINVYESCFSL